MPDIRPDIKQVTVLGTGVLGSQIAYQAAFHGYAVTAYDISDEIIQNAVPRFAQLAGIYQADGVLDSSGGNADAALQRIRLTSDLADAVSEADLVIEAVPENLELKRGIYTKLGHLAPE